MLISIASLRGPKVEAAKKVVESIRPYITREDEIIEVRPYDVQGGIDMPRTLDDLLRGAQRRAESLQNFLDTQAVRADFFIGMEGGFHSVTHGDSTLVFLQSWAYVSDGLQGFFGSSGNIAVPDSIAHCVMQENEELGEVIDRVANLKDVRSKQGTWGILTRDLLTRQRSFEIALLAAFAPFYNRGMYT